MKWLEVFQFNPPLPTPASLMDPNESFAPIYVHQGGDWGTVNRAPFPRTQQNVPDQDSNLDRTPETSTLTMKSLHLPFFVDLPISIPKGPPCPPLLSMYSGLHDLYNVNKAIEKNKVCKS